MSGKNDTPEYYALVRWELEEKKDGATVVSGAKSSKGGA
jgi:hypothetical protein